MKSKLLFATVLLLASFSPAQAQTLDTAKLDPFLTDSPKRGKRWGAFSS